ncbi:MAG: sigma-54-dependent Fis family transcriptional regulator [Candidatus Marinimicrobia bacterium]|nr:sigma-54-dependent Fis family transcriptional regulator [Candidatus Neomarinimicrobiota bacterium]
MTFSKILIVDDEDMFREDLAKLLTRKGFECDTAPTAEIGLEKVTDFYPDIVLTDIVMPGINGIELVEKIRLIHPDCSVIVMTAFGSMDTAVSAFRKGAVDYILKPITIEELEQKLHRIEEKQQLLRELRYLRNTQESLSKSNKIVGTSESIKHIIELIGQVAPTQSNVLITGESGTGKELVARAVHDQSQAAQNLFVALNCSGFSEHLLESELFGYKKGAFTGAVKDKAGFFETAGNGTVFLDEISEMSVALQGKLLRVLEEKEYYPVGGTQKFAQKARIITATNRNLKDMIANNQFREDLYYRIGVFEIGLPPLRERKSDIPLLADSLIKTLNKEMKRGIHGLASDTIQYLMNYDWPGNVRELRNVIERAIILSSEDVLSAKLLPPELTGVAVSVQNSNSLKHAVRSFERAHLIQALKDHGWNKEATARSLKINPSTLYRKLSDLGIESK